MIPGYDAVNSATLKAGAYGLVISGAGPTLIALVDTAQAADVAVAMAEAWKAQGILAQARSLSLDTQGARTV